MSDARTMGERAINRRPAVTPPGRSSAGGSTGRIPDRKKAEPRKDSASAAIANGAVMNCASSPLADGPPTNDSARLPLSSDCPSTYLSAATIETNSVLSDTLNKMARVPAANVTANICASVSMCSA
jgi:hypothetical protein